MMLVMVWSMIASAGGIFVGFTYFGTFNNAFNLGPTPARTFYLAALAEIVSTFMLCFVVLHVAVCKVHAGQDQYYGITTGFVVAAGAYGGGVIFMAFFNPVNAFGIDVSGAHLGFDSYLLYTVFEFTGAALAVVFYWILRPEYETSKIKGLDRLVAKFVSEFLGTFMFVLTVGRNVLNGSMAGAFSTAASITRMVFALGTVSGVHFNPTVTVAIMCAGRDKCPPKEEEIYMVEQIRGGLCLASRYSAIKGGKAFQLKPVVCCCADFFVADFVFIVVLAFGDVRVRTDRVDARVRNDRVDARVRIDRVDVRVRIDRVDARVRIDRVDARVRTDRVDARVRSDRVGARVRIDRVDGRVLTDRAFSC